MFALDEAEVEQALAIGKRLSRDLHDLIVNLIDREIGAGVPEYVIMAAVTAECLLMAKCMHQGSPESFVVMAVESADQIRNEGEESCSTRRRWNPRTS